MSQCKQCGKDFPIHDRDRAFYHKVSPSIAGQTYELPAPSHCPECRLVRRLTWRNETALYQRKSDFTGKDIISIFSPDKPYKVYELGYYDKLDLLQWGIDIDPTQAIFPQMASFLKQVPKQSLVNFGENENGEYCNYSFQCKSCYLCFWGDYGQDSLYNYAFVNLKDCVDTFWLFDAELCYEMVDCNKCFRSKYCQNSDNCSDSAFLFNCKDLNHCMFCVNLSHKEYCLFNQQYTREEYLEKIKAWDLGSRAQVEKCWQEFQQFLQPFPIRNLNLVNVENVTGDVNRNSKNCFDCYHMVESEDCSYGIDHIKNHDVYDSYGCVELSNCCEVLCALNSQNIYFSFDIYTSYNLFYSISCRDCKDCFGCVGLRHKQYCIFNKQYTKEQYEALLAQILTTMTATGEWGEFLPAQISPFGYNETAAQEYFPLSKDQALAKNYLWSDYQAPLPQVKSVLEGTALADNIQTVDDSVLDNAISCKDSGRLFRLTKQELAFYRTYNIPLPQRHSDERRHVRMRLKNPRAIHSSQCDKCHNEMLTSVPSTNTRPVYCEKCYSELMY